MRHARLSASPVVSSLPIGVFDSGIGGLTVLKALIAALPNENTLYLGDTARLPYGTKSAEVVVQYSIANTDFLVRQGIKVLVVACNTVSAVALPTLQAKLNLPVIGVIQPAVESLAGWPDLPQRIGVIGTPGTIASGAYQHALKDRFPGAEIRAKACPLFVPLAEEGWTTGKVAEWVAEEYLSEFRGHLDALILGCTHYPLLESVIQRAVGPVALIDSALATAKKVADELVRLDLINTASLAARHNFYVTDVPHHFKEVGARFLGRAIETVEQTDVLRFSAKS